MNVPSQKELQALFDQMQHDHPIGSIASKYVENALKRHPPPQKEKTRKRHGSTHEKHSRHSNKIDKSEKSEKSEKSS